MENSEDDVIIPWRIILTVAAIIAIALIGFSFIRNEKAETKRFVTEVKGSGYESQEFEIKERGRYEIAFRCRPGITWIKLARNGRERGIINFHYNATSEDFRFDVVRPGRFKLEFFSDEQRHYNYTLTVHRIITKH